LAGTSKMPSELTQPGRQQRDVALEVAEHHASPFHARSAKSAPETASDRYASQSPKRE